MATDLDLSPEDRALVGRVRAHFDESERRHRSYRRKWEHLYSLYRSHDDFRAWWLHATPRERDVAVRDLQGRVGAELFIPYSFEVVETILPRMLSNRPRMLILPRGQTREENVENMRLLIDWQQEQSRYTIRSQDTAKSGLIYGLGVQKTFWRRKTRNTKKVVRGIGTEWTVEDVAGQVVWDDPDAENVDIFDFFWDPMAALIGDCRYAIHRAWRDTAYVRDRVRSGVWGHLGERFAAEVEQSTSEGKYDELVAGRLRAAGHEAPRTEGSALHEVWEYHDGDQVVTVLDRQWPVQVGPNPAWHGELPFHCYRPSTQGTTELPGIGEIEPIEDLQEEMNTLRSQRRDNATYVLQRVFAYADGLVDPDDIQFGPGMKIPVNGDPRELLFPIPVGDIPNSGYQEEASLKGDIERVTGISDPVAGASSAGETATGVQLVQAAANVRIQNKTYRFEGEVIAPAAQQWVELNQQKIRGSRDVPVQRSAGRWSMVKMGPAELEGDMFVVAEGGATAPDNVPQQRQDAQVAHQMLGQNPRVEQTELLRFVLRNLGVKHPDSWLLPDQRVPATLPMVMERAGLAPEVVGELLGQAQALEQAQRQQQNGQAPEVPAGG